MTFEEEKGCMCNLISIGENLASSVRLILPRGHAYNIHFHFSLSLSLKNLDTSLNVQICMLGLMLDSWSVTTEEHNRKK